ncbi:MAG TPA: outer membrane protein assembly factor BamD [Pyrinomonadaceae bacterium]|mgnify:CR=1 FL=1|nr:outer membrane protein assembly factor BamD [Pyrinomonadaceae bacterium]
MVTSWSLSAVRRILKTRFARIFILSVAAVSTSIGCGWSFLTDNSIRFNSRHIGRGFYRLPPLPIEYDPVTKKERSTIEVENYYDIETEDDDWAIGPKGQDRPDDTWEAIRRSIDDGKLRGIESLLDKFLEQTHYKPYWESSLEGGLSRQERRNTAYDLKDALTARLQGSKENAVVEYMSARLAQGSSPDEIESRSDTTVRDGNLKDNWEYLRAAVLTRAGKKEEALAAFRSHKNRFPRSEKNEAVLYMIARLTMERGDLLAALCEDEKCEIEEWGQSIREFQKLMQRYPNGRYFHDARGWIAHMYRHEDKTAESLAEYYRLLGNRTDRQWRLEAKKSLQILGHEFDDATLDRVEQLIAAEPDAALAYAYHRIYNHAVDLTYVEYNDWCCYGDDKWSQMHEETERVNKEKFKGRHELRRIAQFANAMVHRHGYTRASGEFLLRLAQAHLELENFRDAGLFAERALAGVLSGESRAQALWVRGSVEHREGRLTVAKATFLQLIREFPDDKLTEGARRLLALTAEDQDDLEFALDLYFELKYEQDIAYFVDVLLSTDRLARYVSKRTTSAHYNILLYSLGVRYMREGRWDEAKCTLSRVITEKGTDHYLEYSRGETWFFPKEPAGYYGEPDKGKVKTSWVVQDLKTIDIIQHYERMVESAQEGDAKAEALYQLASAYFESDDLAFYNPAMWDGARVGSLYSLQFSSHTRLPNETRTIFEHLQGHEGWARSIPIFEEIVARYPDSKVARDALYTVAVAHERLASRNCVWGQIYERGLFAGPRMVTYQDVRNIYPDYQLPRGTYGWKPSTRTVNGGPGWAARPKPLPRLSREQRFVRKLKHWANDYGPAVWDSAVTVKAAWTGLFNAAFLYERLYFFFVLAGFSVVVGLKNRLWLRDRFYPGVAERFRKRMLSLKNDWGH